MYWLGQMNNFYPKTVCNAHPITPYGRACRLAHVWQYLQVMFAWGNRPWVDAQLAIHFSNNLFFYLVAILCATPLAKILVKVAQHRFRQVQNWARPAITFALLIISTVMLVGQTYNPFLYFRF